MERYFVGVDVTEAIQRAGVHGHHLHQAQFKAVAGDFSFRHEGGRTICRANLSCSAEFEVRMDEIAPAPNPVPAGAIVRYDISRRLTVAYVLSDNLDKVTCGVARCAPKDQFNRRIGRALALSRLAVNYGKDNPLFTMRIIPAPSNKDSTVLRRLEQLLLDVFATYGPEKLR